MPKSAVGWESYSVSLKLCEPRGSSPNSSPNSIGQQPPLPPASRLRRSLSFASNVIFPRPASSEECVRVRDLILVLFALFALTVVGNSQDRTTGGIKGKVKVETGTPAGVSVVVRSGDR